ncbi:aldehyde dehydrogenase [Streptomyces sp. NPDC003236]|uniref:aldehyde dehydrogenase n=1 Tax=unclassified Streptomyces TaxID=2593676 RepID=UPI001F119C89|nr:aldehyde dehydrogenase [Streptomyces sp. Tu 4128]
MSNTMWQGQYDSLFIGGEWVAPSTDEKLTVLSPYTEKTIATIPMGVEADIDRAVAAAREAFDNGPWPRMSLAERSEVMRRLSDEMRANERVMAELVSAEMGTPIQHSVPIQAQRPRLIVDQMIELAQSYPFEEIREAPSGRALVHRRPTGVLGAIVPWNAPHLITIMKLAPALLAGCTMVVKSAPDAPLNQYLFAEMAQRAGLPAGVLNIVSGDRPASEHLVSHPGVDTISFTGSTGVGKSIAAVCAGLLRPVTLELGGKSASVILDDADVESTVDTVLHGALRSNGEVCTAKTRIVLPRRLSSRFVDALAAKVSALKIGDPLDPEVYFGPLVSTLHRDRVEGMIATAVQEGAVPIIGGGRPKGLETGWFVEPTIFTNVTRAMNIAQEEVFGPVLSVLEYDTEEEALAIANDSRYGLSGAVFSSDPMRATRFATRIETGMTEVNGCPAGLAAPFGGVKDSGLGYELGLEGFDEFVEINSIGIPLDLPWPAR